MTAAVSHTNVNTDFLDKDSQENPIQQIKFTLNRIQQETGICVIPAHLGNPMARQFEPTNHAMAYFYQHRAETDSSRGYQDVAGDPEVRRHIARSLMRLNRLDEQGITIGEENILGANGGTGALNAALKTFRKDVTVLVAEPSYPPWIEIARHLQRDIKSYALRREDGYLLNPETIEPVIEKIENANDKPLVLIYHYPHNPTGKTLTKEEAKLVAERLNALCEKHPNLFLIQEDLYLATTAPEMGIYTPLPYLSEQARSRTILLHSPSKMGHAQDRGAVVAAFNDKILKTLRDVISVDSLGPSHPAMLATALTLRHIADGGLDAVDDPGSDPQNYRYKTAAYYQQRLKIAADGIKEIEEKLSANGLVTPDKPILPDGTPRGTYYLFPSFEFLQGKPIPEALLAVFRADEKNKGRNDMTFRNADDVALALQHAYLLGLQPVTISPGTMFTQDEEKKKNSMFFRISAISPDERQMHGLVNTLKGLTQRVLEADGITIDLGAQFLGNEEMLSKFPAPPAAPPADLSAATPSPNVSAECLTSRFLPRRAA